METKASLEKDGSISFDKVLNIQEKLLYIFLLGEQAKMVLKQVRVAKTMWDDNQDYLKKFKKQIKLNRLGTELISDDKLESNELVIKLSL